MGVLSGQSPNSAHSAAVPSSPACCLDQLKLHQWRLASVSPSQLNSCSHRLPWGLPVEFHLLSGAFVSPPFLPGFWGASPCRLAPWRPLSGLWACVSDVEVLKVERVQLLDAVLNLCTYHHPENIQLPPG